jgi:HAD superfamily hydrolase (TIGR01458 family)
MTEPVAALAGVRGLILDLDGTVYDSAGPIPGAIEAIAAVRTAGLGLRFATNTTRRPRTALVARLRELGVEATSEEILTAPVAAAAWLRAQGFTSVALYLAEAAHVEFRDFSFEDHAPQAVVVGDLGDGWTFERLNRAFRQLLGGAVLVAIQKNRYWKTGEGLSLDAGPFVAALEYAVGTEATVVGKPSAAFFEGAARALDAPLFAVAVVGDDIATDVAGAQTAGARGVLVKTGKYRSGDLERSDARPDLVIDSVADLPAALGL